MKSKLMAISLVLAFVLGIICMPVSAKPTIVAVTFHEDGVRKAYDGTVLDSWTNDFYDVDFVKTGNAFHKIGHWAVSEADYSTPVYVDNPYWWYWVRLPDITGSPVTVSNGEESAWTSYTSLVSGLAIREKFKGDVSINPTALTMSGSYTQYAYVISWDESTVLSYYPNAVRVGNSNIWFLDYTVYTVYP